MRKKICGVIAVLSFIGLTAILDLFDAGYISFGVSNILILLFGLLLCIGLYGAEVFIFQQRSDDDGKKIN